MLTRFGQILRVVALGAVLGLIAGSVAADEGQIERKVVEDVELMKEVLGAVCPDDAEVWTEEGRVSSWIRCKPCDEEAREAEGRRAEGTLRAAVLGDFSGSGEQEMLVGIRGCRDRDRVVLLRRAVRGEWEVVDDSEAKALDECKSVAGVASRDVMVCAADVSGVSWRRYEVVYATSDVVDVQPLLTLRGKERPELCGAGMFGSGVAEVKLPSLSSRKDSLFIKVGDWSGSGGLDVVVLLDRQSLTDSFRNPVTVGGVREGENGVDCVLPNTTRQGDGYAWTSGDAYAWTLKREAMVRNSDLEKEICEGKLSVDWKPPKARLTRSQVEQVLSGVSEDIEKCLHAAELAVSSTVMVSFRVDGAGEVSDVEIEEDDFSREARSCVRSEVEAAQFPESEDGGREITYPFTLRSDSGEDERADSETETRQVDDRDEGAVGPDLGEDARRTPVTP